jgi:hypothetical protein
MGVPNKRYAPRSSSERSGEGRVALTASQGRKEASTMCESTWSVHVTLPSDNKGRSQREGSLRCGDDEEIGNPSACAEEASHLRSLTRS